MSDHYVVLPGISFFLHSEIMFLFRENYLSNSQAILTGSVKPSISNGRPLITDAIMDKNCRTDFRGQGQRISPKMFSDLKICASSLNACRLYSCSC